MKSDGTAEPVVVAGDDALAKPKADSRAAPPCRPYAGVGVEAKVKAHISTYYIDASGRGLEAPDNDALLTPAEYYKQVYIPDTTQTRAAEEESVARKAAAAAGRAEAAATAVREAAARRTRAAMEGNAELHSALVDQRAAAAQEAAAAEALRIGDLYAAAESATAEGEETAKELLLLLKPSEAAVLRNREAAVVSRHEGLRGLRARARAVQATTIDAARARQEAAQRHTEQEILVQIAAQEAAVAAQIQADAKAEFTSIVQQRALETKARREEELIVREAGRQLATWAVQRQQATAAAEEVARVALVAEAARHEAEMRLIEVRRAASYQQLLQVQEFFDRQAQELQREVARHIRGGCALELLYQAAHKEAGVRQRCYHGLLRLAQASLWRTAYTPSVLPVPPAVEAAMRGAVANYEAGHAKARDSPSKGRRKW